jgi:bacteriorhodopsin
MPSLLFTRHNGALDVNPPAGAAQLTVHGSDWLWTVTAIFIVAFLSLFVLNLLVASIAGEKIFYHLLLIANLVGAFTYYAAASDLGWTVILEADSLSHGLTRQIFYTKYILWVVSFPTAIISLGILTGTPFFTILYQVFLSWAWVIGYLVAAFTATNYKWGFFALGTVAWLILAFSTLVDSRGHETTVPRHHHRALKLFINFLWLLYPIAWGLSDGGNRIGVTGGFVFFGILDLLFVPLLSLGVLFAARGYDYSALGRRRAYNQNATPVTGGPVTNS